MAKGYNTTALSDYVLENKDVLIKDVILGTSLKDSTISHLAKQMGVKTSEILNYLNIGAVLQNGRGCGFTASGNTELSERVINVATIKVNDEFCPDDLLGKYAEYLVRIGADKNAENMPFEAEIANGIAKSIEEQLEKLIWVGSKEQGDLIDGFVTLAKGADSASTIVVDATGAQAFDAINDRIIPAIPERIIDKAVINVSPAVYREALSFLVHENLYHYDFGNGAGNEFYWPGTSIKVRKCAGLEGTKVIYASAWDNMVFGTDAMNDKEEFRLWFSDDADLFKYKVKFNAGVTTYFPDFVVLGELS